MSKDNITLTIGAKDLASGVIYKVRASTIALGTAAGQLLARGVTGAMNALRGMVSSVLEAERANVMMDAALRGTGEYTPELARRYRDLANAIQSETGASDESVKSTISALTTMGVSAEKMGGAARSVEALKALGRDGSLAMVAVARAMQGDISAFERFAPEVRNATTLIEKYEAANKLLNAGYAQQQANLQTVGGAWAALKGRIGDALEDIGNAVTGGLRLGKSFDEAQAALGRFLQSDQWQSFTERLSAGAGYMADIVKALASGNGTKDVAKALGSVILAALRDGADYVGAKISSSFGRQRLDDFDPRLAAASRFWGAKSAGASWDQAFSAMDKPQPQKTGGNLSKALADLEAVIDRANQAAAALPKNQASISSNIKAATKETQKQKEQLIDIGDAMYAEEMGYMEKVWLEDKKADESRNQLEIEKKITKYAEAEAESRKAAAEAAAAAKDRAKMGTREVIDKAAQGNKDLDQTMRDEAKERRRIQRLREKQARGIRLSEADAAALVATDRQKAQIEALGKAKNRDLMEADQLKKMQERERSELKALQERTAKACEAIQKTVAQSLEVQ